jgi:predicted TIM-barrel fold metal-dependent hydrolase
MYKIIDIHTHTYPNAIAERAKVALEHFYEFTCEGDGTVDDLAESSEKAGVSGMLLLSVATNVKQIKNVNLWAASAKADLVARGFEAAAFGGIHQDCPDMAAELDHIKELGLSGIKIHPDIQGVDIDDRRMYELYSLIEGELPIYFHMGDNRPQYRFSEAQRLIKIMKEFPRLKVIAAHFGGYCAWEQSKELIRAGGENIMFDTSSALWAMTPEDADKLVGILGVEHLMFGTDYPVMHAENELKLFMKLKLTESERQDILYNNAKSFIQFTSK